MRKRQKKKLQLERTGKVRGRINRQRETELAADLAGTFDQLIETENRLIKARRSEREARQQADYNLKVANRYRRQWEDEQSQAKKDTRRALFAGLVLGIVIAGTATAAGLSAVYGWGFLAGLTAGGK